MIVVFMLPMIDLGKGDDGDWRIFISMLGP